MCFKDKNNKKRREGALFSVCFALMLTLGSVAPGHAYATDKAVLEQQFNEAFSAMLDNPADTKLTMRYAELAVELGDYESAIPPLERLLMVNPDLVDVRLEVGVMYYLLNSPAMAKEYLYEVKKSGKATPEQVKRADEFLAKM